MTEQPKKSKDLILPGEATKALINKSADVKPGWVDTNKAWFSFSKDVMSMKLIKDLFMRDLDKARKAEQEFCTENKLPQVFRDRAYNQVVDILDQCKDFAEVEALAQFIFTDNTIPELEDVKKRGFAIYLQFPKQY